MLGMTVDSMESPGKAESKNGADKEDGDDENLIPRQVQSRMTLISRFYNTSSPKSSAFFLLGLSNCQLSK
ncbi:hypothetical protein ACTXT7_015219 [Hymenolepis weldensis]